MRFSAPRSLSPSPERHYRSQSTYGVPSDSSDEDEVDSSAESDAESVVSSASSDSFCYKSESEVPPPPPRPVRPPRSLAERHYMEDTIASIRLHAKHHDLYEEWENETKSESFRTARINQSLSKGVRNKEQSQKRAEEAQRRAALHRKQMENVQAALASLQLRREKEEQMLRARWEARNQEVWKRIENVIKIEEDKVKAKLEAERIKREEEEKKRREEEERVRAEVERKRKEEEERRRKEEEEEAEKRRQEEAERERQAKEEAELQERKALGFTTSSQDWKRARDILRTLKSGTMKIVKADKELKSAWSAGRRAITPKIGQLTNDPQSIARISQQIRDLVRPSPPHHPHVYLAMLSSLAKAILLQAETEVTAEKRSAAPLARVAATLLGQLDGFADIFWAKLCQRTGGWPIPIIIPSADSDGTPFDAEQRRKVLGYRPEEALSDYTLRVTGIMRVYFHIVCMPVAQPLDPVFRLTRYWTYFARILASPQLLQSSVAPSVLHAALDVGGVEAREIWGPQWVKLLERLYEGVTTGFHDSNGRMIGGNSSEGIAARVRVQLEIERIMSS